MWNSLLTSHPRRTWAVAALLIASAAMIVLWPPRVPQSFVQNGGERLRGELDLRDAKLYVKGADEPFTGILVENYDKDARKLEIRIVNGQANGLSQGWYDDGQLETEESFVNGVSHGLRTRWHPNGAKKSEATIRNGQITGLYVEWHDNGQKAAETTIEEGQPHGLAEAWHPSGKLKSRVQLDHGIPKETQFFKDAEPIAQAGRPADSPVQ